MGHAHARRQAPGGAAQPVYSRRSGMRANLAPSLNPDRDC